MGTSYEKQMQEKEEMFRGDSDFIEEQFCNPVGDEVTCTSVVKINCYRCNSHVVVDEVHNCMGSYLRPTPRPKHNLMTERFGKRLDEEELPEEPYTDIELMQVLDQCVKEFLESNAEGKKLAQGAVDWLNRKYGRMSL